MASTISLPYASNGTPPPVRNASMSLSMIDAKDGT
jgi:hypothetical protein